MCLCLPRSSRRGEGLRGPHATQEQRRAGTRRRREKKEKGPPWKAARETKHADTTNRPASKHDFSFFPVWPTSSVHVLCLCLPSHMQPVRPVNPQFTRGTASSPAPGCPQASSPSRGLSLAAFGRRSPQPAGTRRSLNHPNSETADHRPPTVLNFNPFAHVFPSLFHPPRSNPSAIGAQARSGRPFSQAATSGTARSKCFGRLFWPTSDSARSTGRHWTEPNHPTSSPARPYGSAYGPPFLSQKESPSIHPSIHLFSSTLATLARRPRLKSCCRHAPALALSSRYRMQSRSSLSRGSAPISIKDNFDRPPPPRRLQPSRGDSQGRGRERRPGRVGLAAHGFSFSSPSREPSCHAPPGFVVC